jgi:uncharacterized membrane protein YeaQ/YmgE (transglycosylase-associated protein family)
MDSILFVVVGLIVGFAASHAASWQRHNDVGWSMLVGILGAFGGALLGRAMGYSTGEPATFVASALGAVAIVTAYLALANRRTA